jgi:hypothetical protein
LIDAKASDRLGSDPVGRHGGLERRKSYGDPSSDTFSCLPVGGRREGEVGSMEATMQNVPWNKGRLTGQKRPLKPRDVWAIRVRLQLRHRDLGAGAGPLLAGTLLPILSHWMLYGGAAVLLATSAAAVAIDRRRSN